MAIGTSKEITVLHSFLIGIRVFGGILILVVCYLQKVNPLESKVVAELPLLVAAGTIQWILVEPFLFYECGGRYLVVRLLDIFVFVVESEVINTCVRTCLDIWIAWDVDADW